MFPLIPALILLLLQGPSNFERLSIEGRLPAAIGAIQRQLEAPDARPNGALESLITACQGHELVEALRLLLKPVDPPAPTPDVPSITRIEGEEFVPVEGFVACRRTRDGP